MSSEADATEVIINKPMTTTTTTTTLTGAKSQPIQFISNNKKMTTTMTTSDARSVEQQHQQQQHHLGGSLIEHFSSSFGHNYLSTSAGTGKTCSNNEPKVNISLNLFSLCWVVIGRSIGRFKVTHRLIFSFEGI